LPRLINEPVRNGGLFLFDEKLKNVLNIGMVASNPFRGERYGKRSIS